MELGSNMRMNLKKTNLSRNWSTKTKERKGSEEREKNGSKTKATHLTKKSGRAMGPEGR